MTMVSYYAGVDDGGGICSPPAYSSSSFFQSLKHDVKLVVGTIFVTCIALMSYNYYLLFHVKKKKAKENGIQWKDRFSSLLADDVAASDADAVAVAASARHPTLRSTAKILRSVSSMSGKSMRSMAADLAKIDGVSDSGNFLSAILDQLWSHMSVAIGDSIKESLDPTLRKLSVPMHFIKLDLGDVPIKTTNMTILRVKLGGEDGDGSDDDAGDKALDVSEWSKGSRSDNGNAQAGIQINVDVVWDGNCDIMLQATLTKSAKLTFGVKHIKLAGRLHILLSPLTNALPVISAVQYGFTNPPKIEMSFTGAAGKILNVVQSSLLGVIDSCLAGVLVLPNRMVMPMDLGRYDFLETYRPPVGMVRLTAVRGRGFTLLKGLLLNDIPDIYCIMRLGASDSFRTSTREDDLTPCWENESSDFILYDMDQKVYVNVYDEDLANADTLLGGAEVTCRELFGDGKDGVADGMCELELELDGTKTGCYVTVKAELLHLTDKLHSFTSSEYDGKNRLCGLATIIVTKAFNVPLPREDAATFIKVQYGGEGTPSKFRKEFFTGTVMDYPGIDALNP